MNIKVTRIKKYPFRIYFQIDKDCYFIKECADEWYWYENCLNLYARKVDEHGRYYDVQKIRTLCLDWDKEYYEFMKILDISGRKAQSAYLQHILNNFEQPLLISNYI